jgi:hypothetical protein
MAFGDAAMPDASNAPLARIFFIEIAWPAEPASPKNWEIYAQKRQPHFVHLAENR